MKKFCKDTVFKALSSFSTFKFYKNKENGTIMVAPVEGEGTIFLEDDKVVLFLPKSARSVSPAPPKGVKFLFGCAEIPYKAEFLNYLSFACAILLPGFPECGLLNYIYEHGLAVGIELRTGVPDLDYPNIPFARKLFECLDNPLLDSAWCREESIIVCFSEFLNNGTSFNISCLGSWVSLNMPELIEEKYFSRFIRTDFMAKYCGEFHREITKPTQIEPLIFGKSIHKIDDRFSGL